MRNNDIRPPTGISLRHRVRALTAGVTGAAVLATAAVTATMAYAQAGSDSAGSPSTGNAAVGSAAGTITGSSPSAGSTTSTDSGVLAAPLQPPTVTNNTGHAGSGGS